MIVTTIRIDEELYNQVAIIANKEERSINAQIVYCVKKFIEDLNKKNDM